MAMIQMNTRIDDELKARGDEVFARFGLTPSQAVRAVWEYADEHGEPPEFMRPPTSAEVEAEIQRKLAIVEESTHIWENFFISQGLPVPEPRVITSDDLLEEFYFNKPKTDLTEDELRLAYYDDLRYEAYLEKATERGLL